MKSIFLEYIKILVLTVKFLPYYQEGFLQDFACQLHKHSSGTSLSSPPKCMQKMWKAPIYNLRVTLTAWFLAVDERSSKYLGLQSSEAPTWIIV